MGKQILQEGLADVFIGLVGEYMGSGILVALLISAAFGYKLLLKLKRSNNKYLPELAKSAWVISVGFAVWVFAGILFIQAIFHNYYLSVEEKKVAEEAKRVASSQEQDKIKRSSPEYREAQIRAWLDKIGYSSKVLGRSDKYEFSLQVNGSDLNFILRQEKEQSDVLLLETSVFPSQEVVEKLAKIDKDALERSFLEIKMELLRQQVEVLHVTDYGQNHKLIRTFVVLRHQFPYEPEKQISFVKEFLHFKRAKETLDTYYQRIRMGVL